MDKTCTDQIGLLSICHFQLFPVPYNHGSIFRITFRFAEHLRRNACETCFSGSGVCHLIQCHPVLLCDRWQIFFFFMTKYYSDEHAYRSFYLLLSWWTPRLTPSADRFEECCGNHRCVSGSVVPRHGRYGWIIW